MFVVHMYRFGSSCLDETLFRHSSVLLHSCAVPEGGGMGGNERSLDEFQELPLVAVMSRLNWED